MKVDPLRKRFTVDRILLPSTEVLNSSPRPTEKHEQSAPLVNPFLRVHKVADF